MCGRGNRLQDLTAWRAKPAVPFAGKLNIIDFAQSNPIGAVACIHRFGSSLNEHVHFHVCVVDGVFEEVAGERSEPTSDKRGTKDYYSSYMATSCWHVMLSGVARSGQLRIL